MQDYANTQEISRKAWKDLQIQGQVSYPLENKNLNKSLFCGFKIAYLPLS